MGDWDPGGYLKFEDYRTRPSVDLVSHIRVAAPRSVIDLGCGPGNSTQVLRSRWPGAHVLGLDSSAEMIAAAREAFPEQEWVLGD
ncbi:MAG: methyltransferase domain-containing protein, partial [Coriobacteriales bacterium]|nr:methyltransferase domain-containing protein [Coriobacteriales bacterium]